MNTFDPPTGSAKDGNLIPLCDGLGLTTDAARGVIRRLARAAGFSPDGLREWSTADVPGAPQDVPPMYYAAVVPGERSDDMPLGLGDSPDAALADLLWALGGPALYASVMADQSAPPEHSNVAETGDRALTGLR